MSSPSSQLVPHKYRAIILEPHLFVQFLFTKTIFNMSDTPQDQTTARVAPAVAAKEQPATQRQFESTPAKKKHGQDLAFTSTAANYDKVRK